MKALDGNRLREIATANETALITANALQGRERNRSATDIARTKSAMVREGKKIVEADFMQFWKDLQSVGAGTIVYGRKDKPDRFEWHYAIKDVGHAMFGGEKPDNVKVTEKPMAKKTAGGKEVIHISLEEPDTRSIQFVLPSGGRVEMTVPKKISEAEANAVVREFKKLSASV